jgi:hypothetical protein
MKDGGSGRLDIVALLGGGKASEGGDDDESPMDMACDAMFTAIRKDDKSAFKMALSDYLGYRDEKMKGKTESSEPSESAADYSED